MSGIDFRGRRRFRNSDATERLSALLGEDRATGGSHAARGAEAWLPDTPARDAAGPGPGVRDWSSPQRPSHELPPAGSRAPDAVTSSAAIERATTECAAADRGREPEPPLAAANPDGASDRPIRSPTESVTSSDPVPHSRHREDVTVRRSLSRPALVLLCVVLLVALAAGCAALLGGGGDQDDVIASAGASTGEHAPGEEAGGTKDASGARSSDGTDVEQGASADGPSSTPGPSGSAGPGPVGSTGGVLTVHVVGEVKDPSVVSLSPGARVMDAVEAAGGFTPAAVKDRINLAENVVDGAQIVIPNRGNVDDVMAARAAPGGGSGGATAPALGGAGKPAAAPTGAAAPGARGGGSSGAASGSLVNLNTATEAELEGLPKVGPVLAQRVVEFRTQHGPFTSPEQLDDVSGVGPAMLEALLPLVTV